MSILQGLSDIVSHIDDIWSSIVGIFADVDFTVLYSWLPSDISGVISSFITVLIFIALIGLIKKIVVFLG